MAEITDEQRQAVTRDICKWEGHNWAWVTTWGDSLTRYICTRGCGAQKASAHYGQYALTGEQAIRMLTELGPAARLHEIEIVNEPWKTGRDE